jgi:hypothetical protein
MSVHIESDLNVRGSISANSLSVKSGIETLSEAKVAGLQLWDGYDYSWQLYSTTTSARLICDSYGIHFTLEDGSISLRTSGSIHGRGIYTNHLTVNGNATIVGTLSTESLQVSSLDISNVSFANTTFTAKNAAIANNLTAKTLAITDSATATSATFMGTLEANSAVVTELTVLQEATVNTVSVVSLLHSPLIKARRAEFSELYLKGKEITGSSTGGGGDVTIPTDLSVETLTANNSISIPGTQFANGSIAIETDAGIRVGTAGAITIADETSAPIVRIDNTGIVTSADVQADNISADTFSTGTLQVTGSGQVGDLLKVAELNVSSSLTAHSAYIAGLGASDLTVTYITVNGLSASSVTVASGASVVGTLHAGTLSGRTVRATGSVEANRIETDHVEAESVLATSSMQTSTLSSVIVLSASATTPRLRTDHITTTNDADVISINSHVSVVGSLSSKSLFVNGIEITDNGGDIEIPATIRVSAVTPLQANAAVVVPRIRSSQMQVLYAGDLSPTAVDTLGSDVSLILQAETATKLKTLKEHVGWNHYLKVGTNFTGSHQLSAQTLTQACTSTTSTVIRILDLEAGHSSPSQIIVNRAITQHSSDKVDSSVPDSNITLAAETWTVDYTSFENTTGQQILAVEPTLLLKSAALATTTDGITAQAYGALSRMMPLSLLSGEVVPNEYPVASRASTISELTPSGFKLKASSRLLRYADWAAASNDNVTTAAASWTTDIDLSGEACSRAYDLNILSAPSSYSNPGLYVTPTFVKLQALYNPFNVPSLNTVPLANVGLYLAGYNVTLRCHNSGGVTVKGPRMKVEGSMHVKNELRVGKNSDDTNSLEVSTEGISMSGHWYSLINKSGSSKSQLIYSHTADGQFKRHEFGNTTDSAFFYTNLQAALNKEGIVLDSGIPTPSVVKKLEDSEFDYMNACIPLSLMLALFQLKQS